MKVLITDELVVKSFQFVEAEWEFLPYVFEEFKESFCLKCRIDGEKIEVLKQTVISGEKQCTELLYFLRVYFGVCVEVDYGVDFMTFKVTPATKGF